MDIALLVIDMQNVFFGGATWHAVPHAQSVLGNITELIARARPHGAPVFFVQHCETDGPFLPGTATWELHPDLGVTAADIVLRKSSPDSFRDTELAAMLTRRGVGRLVVAGNQTEFCIDTTVRAACSRGYDVTLAADAHATWDNPHLSAAQIVAHHNHTLAEGFADVMPTAAIFFA